MANSNSWQLENDKGNGMMMRRKRNIENILHLFNLCAVLFLFSHSHSHSHSYSFPITLQTLSHLYHAFFHNSFYAFLLLNAIILILFALSNNHNVAASTDYSRLHVTAYSELPGESTSTSTSTSSRVFEETVAAVTETTMEGETISVSESFERCVEQLSEDEFNRAVEDFIAMHKRMQWEEQIGYLACTPSN